MLASTDYAEDLNTLWGLFEVGQVTSRSIARTR
jgi:hypothetical protein